MSYNVELTDNFKREAKRLIKKYRSLSGEILSLVNELEQDPTKGTHLGNNIYKIRLRVRSKGKGQSGGVRVMSFVQVVGVRVLLFSIYNKGEKDSISDSEIKELIKNI